ncbi:MAG: hypothetical protein KUG78_14300 [Kangiellaceae bacterium]|nr:hypothetical protein [Kangiellaceae bacterium]
MSRQQVTLKQLTFSSNYPTQNPYRWNRPRTFKQALQSKPTQTKKPLQLREAALA